MSEQLDTLSRYYVNVKKVWDKPTVKRFSTATATLALVAFFLLVALKPTIETIFTLNKKIADATETEVLMTKKIADIGLAINQYQKIQADLPLLNEYYPKSAEAGKIVEILNQNTKVSGMDTPSYSFSQYQLKGGKGQFSISYNSSNTYPSALNFLQNLMDVRRLIVLTGLNISEEKNSSKLNVLINSEAYYEK